MRERIHGHLLTGLLLFFTVALAAQRSVQGTVTDEAGLPVIGVSVYAEAFPAVGTTTDAEGNYVLAAPEGASTLVFEYVGYATQTLSLPDSDRLDVVLTEGIEISEFVVVGYGSQSPTDVSGAVYRVDGERLNSRAIASIDGALQGQVPGLQLTTNTGQPGAGMTLRIRGNASINAGNEPLYVVDGIPFTTGDFSEAYYGGMDHNVLSDLNPSDIESIEVLKDAAAASIYGSRASNGVVLITTKRGQAGKTRVRAEVSRGIQSDIRRTEMLSGEQFAELSGIDWNGKDADFESALYRTAPVTQASLSLSGGDLKSRFYLSGAYFDQEGTFINQSFDRLSGRLNFDHNATDWLQLKLGLNLVGTTTNIVPSDNNLWGIVTMMYLQPRNVDIQRADGSYSLDGYFFENPVGAAVQKTNLLTTRRTLANVGAKVQLHPRLSFNSRTGVDLTDFRERVYNPATTFQGGGSGGEAFLNTTLATRTIFQNYFDYQDRFGNFRVALLAGVDYERFDLDNASLAGNGFPSPDFQYLVSAASFTNAAQDVTGNRLLSFYTRANVNWLDRYVLTATIRADGSSKFGVNRRFGYFPSVSFGWRMDQESFLENSDWVHRLKLRVSVGETGNQAGIDDFASRGLAFGGNNYGGQPGVAPGTLPNADLRWETTQEMNLGLDFGFWSDRLRGTLDLYDKSTAALLLSRPLPPSSGFTGINQNVGVISNRGFELGLDGRLVDGPLRWELGFQFAANRNRVEQLFAGQGFTTSPFLPTRVDVDQPLAYFFGWRSLGVDSETGDLVFEDLNGDGQLNEADNQFIGSPHPDFIGAVRTEVTWQNFRLNALLNFVQGNEILNYTRAFIEDGLFRGFNQSVRVLDAWQQPGDETDVYRIGGPNAAQNANPSTSHWIEDGSYARLRLVRLSYDFNSTLLERWRLSGLHLYVAGENLLTWTNYSGLDPEANHDGTDNLILGVDFFTQGLNRIFKVGVAAEF